MNLLSYRLWLSLYNFQLSITFRSWFPIWTVPLLSRIHVCEERKWKWRYKFIYIYFLDLENCSPTNSDYNLTQLCVCTSSKYPFYFIFSIVSYNVFVYTHIFIFICFYFYLWYYCTAITPGTCDSQQCGMKDVSCSEVLSGLCNCDYSFYEYACQCSYNPDTSKLSCNIF